MSIFSTPGREGDDRLLQLENPAFISDLHLTQDLPDTIAGFEHFLRGPALEYREVVILGDFFNYWVGDDASFTVKPVTDALRAYTATDRKVYLMQGNRDFLMGGNYAAECGGTLLTDPVPAEAFGTRLLLSHGDAWCTNDPGYQKIRARLRSSWWQWLILRLPIRKRLQIAEKARKKSRAEKVTKPRFVTDVVDKSFLQDAKKFDARIVIHGHTHLPALHPYDENLIRAVLSDWVFEGGKCIRGGWLSFVDGKPVLHGPDALSYVL